ncbi:MAG TPA: copper chaperone PCu(A)C [Ilumatobacteraceae bacterium]|nr:copper chaperone PCu(A)C [Ilumatobacteraceae bacterium]
MNRRTTTFLAPIVALALTVALAACSSDDDAGDVTTPPAGTAAAGDMADDDMGDEDMGDTDMGGGEATAGDLSVSGAWVRQPAEGQTLSAAYGTITNDGDADVTLVGASVQFDATVEIHETLMGDDGTMQMRERDEGFVIPAGGSFVLEPGGPHIMLIDIDPADITDSVDVTLIFDDGTELTVTAEVRALDGMDMDGDMDMDDDMEMDDDMDTESDG